ncbi:unnamed protein product [Trifolium pratense]|uniref:Uncharacterized protein n=1 Tax=Trifolium pratense TaxID=57577 RepID=A0ACB0L375_TRIPR|nr:unnamed protein product [Trifolium pratense]
MADHNKWPSLGQAYTGSSVNNDGQPASAGRGNGGGGRVDGGGRGGGIPDFGKIPDFIATSSGNGGNNENRNKPVYGDRDFNTGFKDKEGSSLKVDIPKMNGNNYNQWAQTVRLVLDGKGRLGFLTGAFAEPAQGDPLHQQWKSENSMIIAWLVSTMEPGIGKPYMFLPSAKDVWEAVKETYSDIQNASQIFGLKSRLWHAKQGDRNVTTYYNELLTLWQELDLCYDDNWKCAEDSVLFLKRQENDRVFMFLAGLNKDLDEVRGRVLGKVPLPTLRETFAEIKREEARQGIMMGKTPRISESEGSALATRNPYEGKKPDEVPRCDYCNREWHTREDCWKLKGKPPNWTPNWKKKKGGRAFQASNSDQGQQSTSTQGPFTTEQLEKLFKLLESQTPSCSVATKGNSVFLSVSPNHTWIVDSGASDHMTGESALFSSYSPCAGNQKIKVADGSFSAIVGKGSVVLSPMLTLKNVLHVPNLSCSLMSVSKLAQDINCQTNFFRSHCVFQDLNSGKMIGSAEESGGLYYFDIGSASQLPSETISSCFESFSVLNNHDDNIMLWHLRLGHPSFPYLKHLFPKLFRNKDISLFKCEACEFAKHHRSHFAIQPYKPSKPFSIIHSDVWGPNRTSTLSLKKWFITFIDDHSRVCWVYLLKGKSDVCQAVKDFCTMVQNQYQTNIQVFRSDNGKEYFNANLSDFFLKNGIIHQSSCPNTPQQNGVAERKNRHLLEVARALLFSSKVPNYLWGEAVLTAAYLINRMPSKVLNFQTPIDTFKECFPSTRVSNDLTLKNFGCTAFVHEHKNVGKLEPRAIKCVFVGYSPTQKGYKCFDPKNKKMEAVLEEMKALEKNKTWSIMTLPDGKKTVGCKWVFTVKYNSDGSIERYKARLVAKGFTQTYGIDYSETFAPVAKLNTVRILLSVAANLDWPLHQLDVKNAFLNGDLEEEVYKDIPPGFEDMFGSNVCKLNRSLYGLKQSPRAWFEKFTQSMKKQGYVQGQADHTLFTKFSQDGKVAVLIVYVDDIVLTGNDTVEMGRVKEKLAADFEIKDLGSMRYFLGMEVARSKDGIVVSQQKYIIDLLKETGMSGCRPADTPMDPNAKLWEKGNVPVDTGRYQRLVGKLIYLSHTRPDIAFSVSVVSQFMHSPFEEHLEAVYKILRYLKATPGKGLFFRKTNERNVSIFTDADWAGSITDRRSTSGYCAYVWGNLVTWRSKKQGVVARSSAEAEFRAMAQGICEGLWIHRVLEELKMKIELPLKLYSDSKAAISIAHNPVQHDRTKHIEIDRHFIKEKLDAGIICLPFVTSSQQTADILTKSLARPTFEHLIGKLGMTDIYAPT